MKSFLPHSPGAGYGCVKQGDSRSWTEKEGGRVVEGEGSGWGGERSEGACRWPHDTLLIKQEWVSKSTREQEGHLARMVCQERLC